MITSQFAQKFLVRAAVAAGMLWCASTAVAQETATLHIPTSAIFEIVVDATEPGSVVQWTLEQNGEFLQTERNPVLHTRVIQEGTLLVRGELNSAAGTLSTLELTLNVQDTGESTQQQQSSDQNGNIIEFIQLSPQVLKMHAARDDIDQILMDLDMDHDTNGDGDPINDNVLNGSFFAHSSNVLYVWMPSHVQKQTILVGAKLQNGKIVSQVLPLENTGTQEVESTMSAGEGIEAKSLSENTIQFTLLESSTQPTVTLWDFGDGKQSMADTPTHTYAEAGSYQVTATVRNLTNGESIAMLSATVNIEKEQASQPEPEIPAETPVERTTSLVPLVIKAALLLLGSILIGAFLIWLLAKLRKKPLDERLAEVEERHFGAEYEDIAEPLPMEMPEESTEEIVQETPGGTPPGAPQEQPTAEKAIPSWLSASPPQPVAESIATLDRQEPPKEESPAPAPESTASVPEWLKPQATPPVEESPPTPTSEPIPETPPAPTPVPPAPAPESTASVPEWLKPQESTVDTQSLNNESSSNVSEPIPSSPVASVPAVTATDQAEAATEEKSAPSEKEARERERKRRKRQRYRANKKAREEQMQSSPASPSSSPNSDDDVKFIISADSVAPSSAEEADDDEKLEA